MESNESPNIAFTIMFKQKNQLLINYNIHTHTYLYIYIMFLVGLVFNINNLQLVIIKFPLANISIVFYIFLQLHNIVDDNLDISYLVEVKLTCVFNMLLVKDHFNSKHVTCIHSITFQ
jgi:hypothetical protein